jgi:hypothetical protein
VHHERGRLGPPGQRQHGERAVDDDQLRRHPVGHPHLLVPAQRRGQLGQSARPVQRRPLHHRPVDHAAAGRVLLRVVLHPGDGHGLVADQCADLPLRAELELQEAPRDGLRPGDHLDQVVHGRFGRLGPELRGQHGRRVLGPLQLVAAAGQERGQRGLRGRDDPPSGTGRGAGDQAVVREAAQHPAGLFLGLAQPVGEFPEIRGTERDERAVRRFLSVVQTYRAEQVRSLPGGGTSRRYRASRVILPFWPGLGHW